MLWYITSFFGDIRVETIDEKSCKVIVQEATAQEKMALELLTKTAIKKKWVPEGTVFGVNTVVQATTRRVANLIAKSLKPTRKLVSAVKFSNGKIEEISEQTFTVPDGKLSKTETGGLSEPKAATTVATPTKGCPPPDFSPAQLRARDCVMAFLSPEQREDFLRFNRFIAVGVTTGHRYMLTSRTNRDDLQRYHRTLYDLDDDKPLCVHDWDIPAEEELHALHIMTQLPGHEQFIRELEDVDLTRNTKIMSYHVNITADNN